MITEICLFMLVLVLYVCVCVLDRDQLQDCSKLAYSLAEDTEAVSTYLPDMLINL